METDRDEGAGRRKVLWRGPIFAEIGLGLIIRRRARLGAATLAAVIVVDIVTALVAPAALAGRTRTVGDSRRASLVTSSSEMTS